MNDLILRIKLYLNSIFSSDLERLNHIYSVNKVAIALGKKYNVDIEKLEIAALLHDATKNDGLEKIKRMARIKFDDSILSNIPKGCLHAYSATVLANQHFNIVDQEILDAITYHCSGRKAMSLVEQIIYISDFIEETRDFVQDGLRELAFISLDAATYLIMKDTINYLENKNAFISDLTMEAYRYYQDRR